MLLIVVLLILCCLMAGAAAVKRGLKVGAQVLAAGLVSAWLTHLIGIWALLGLLALLAAWGFYDQAQRKAP